MSVSRSQKRLPSYGFTLIEIMLVLALLAVLATIVVVAINPSKQLADSRDGERESDVFLIMQALYQYAADNDGSLPTVLTTEVREICRTATSTCTGLYDLSVLTDSEAYLVEMPNDPLCDIEPGVCSSSGTGYFASLTTSGRVTITASSSENAVVSATQ